MKTKSAFKLVILCCVFAGFSQPVISQRQSFQDANLPVSQTPNYFAAVKEQHAMAILRDEKMINRQSPIVNTDYKTFAVNKRRKRAIEDFLKLEALKASLDAVKTKYKNDYYKRKSQAKLDLEAILLISEDLLPNPFEIKPNQNSMEQEPAADEKPENYLQLRTGLRLSGRGDVQETDDGDTYKTYIYYLTLPAYLLYNHRAANGSDKFFAGLGPYYGYGLFGKFIDKVNGETTKEKIKFGKDESGLKHGDFGLGFVAGYVYKRILLQLSYDMGLSNITFDKETKTSNRAFGLSVGYVLK